jgi:hypothetical protein
MTVAVQYNAALDTTKYRPCTDLSRHVNLAIARSTVKLDDLTVAEELILPGDYMTSLDMENQYFQIRLHPSMMQYMGFMVPDPDGTPPFYTFQVMAYGSKPAVTGYYVPSKLFFIGSASSSPSTSTTDESQLPHLASAPIT